MLFRSGADSVTIAIQVSDDRVNWSTTLYAGPNASVGTTPTSCIVLETGGSANTFQYVIPQVLGGVTRSVFSRTVSATINANGFYGFKFARFIVTGDHTGVWAADLLGFVPASDYYLQR